MRRNFRNSAGCDADAVHPLWREFGASAQISDPDAWLDPFCTAAILGRQTDLLLGIAVTDSVRRQGPDLTRALLTLNNSCRGGFVLGIGPGEAESTIAFGYDFSRPTDKLERVLITVRSLLDTGRMPDGMVGRTGLQAQNSRRAPQISVAGVGDRSLHWWAVMPTDG